MTEENKLRVYQIKLIALCIGAMLIITFIIFLIIYF
jgi:hypothetical protein